MAKYLSSSNWVDFNGTGGFNLPATSVEFKVPVSFPSTDTPIASQIGYTIYGTTTEVNPIELQNGVPALIRTLTIPQGTWLLTTVINAEAITHDVTLEAFAVGFISTAGNRDVIKELDNVKVKSGSYFGESISAIYQVAANTVIELGITTAFTQAGGGKFTINNVDDAFIVMTATRLS